MHPRSRGMICPSFANSFAPLRTEGAGNAGCALHPRSRVPKNAHMAHTSIQGSGNTPTSPAQWLYGLLRALPGERAFLPPSLARNLLRKLDASIAAPGPHDFAVRLRSVVCAGCLNKSVHRNPGPTHRDDRETPLGWAKDGATDARDLPDVTNGILPDGLICRILSKLMAGIVGWVERSETHQGHRLWRWVSLRSTHPTT